MPVYRRVGRPGLLGLAARTAVVAGTASAVGGAMSRHQRSLASQTQQGAAPMTTAPEQTAGTSPDTQGIQQLAALHAQGILSDAEFAAAKARVLGI